MKLLVLMLLLYVPMAQTKTYHIILVKGEVKLARTNATLATGDTFYETDKLIFSHPDATVICAEKHSGRMIISPSIKKERSGTLDDLTLLVKERIIPSSSNYRLSSRSLLSSEGYDPVSYFQCRETNDRLLLISDMEIPIKKDYKMDKQHFFFIQFDLDGKHVNRRVDQREGRISFTQSMFAGYSAPSPGPITLGYQYMEGHITKSKLIATFWPSVLSAEDAKKQITVITQHTSYLDREDLLRNILTHFYHQYGKIEAAFIDPLINP